MRMIGGLLLILEQFAEQLANLRLRCGEHASAGRGGSVHPANAASISMRAGLEIALRLERVKDWIQRASADTISVPGQLFDHAETEDLPLHGVVEDVKPNQSGV